ncbi:MAG: thiamine pyrophosphate-dependent dehydrogenase E1 component subunit alpha [Candidatus Methylomirabilales bacterium]
MTTQDNGRVAAAAVAEQAGVVGVPDRPAMLRMMVRIRAFELKLAELVRNLTIKGTLHPYVGQEAVAAGVCAALRREDYISSNHRGHGHALAKGADMPRMMAELLGRATGYCKGKGGSMHIADLDLGMLGCNGIVGGGMGITVGAALSARLRGTDQVSLGFVGDGGANAGITHESMNLAATWRLPAIFVVENNQYALSMPHARAVAAPDIALRAAGYGMPGEVVDGNDVLAVWEATRRAVARARRGEGPTLLECKTYRWLQHSLRVKGPDRPADEEAAWKARCPIRGLADRLMAEGLLTEPGLAEMQAAADREVEDALAFALASPEPGLEEMERDIYAEEVTP